MSLRRGQGIWLLLGLILIAGCVPVFTQNPLYRETFYTIFLSVAMASSLNIILGYAGYISFGHIVFFGLDVFSFSSALFCPSTAAPSRTRFWWMKM